jgi:hypothetical protein
VLLVGMLFGLDVLENLLFPHTHDGAELSRVGDWRGG